MRKRLFPILYAVLIGIQILPHSAAGEEMISEEALSDGAELDQSEIVIVNDISERPADETELFSAEDAGDSGEILSVGDGEDVQFIEDGSAAAEELQSGTSVVVRNAHAALKEYLMQNGSHYSYDQYDIYSISISLDSNYSRHIGISYDPSGNEFDFEYSDDSGWDYISNSGTSVSLSMSVPYNLAGAAYINFSETKDDFQNTNYGYAEVNKYSTIHAEGNNSLKFSFWELNISTQQEASASANAYLTKALGYWNDAVLSRAGITFTDLGFVEIRQEDLKQPVLIAAYNGAKGIGIKFYAVENAAEYVIQRKFNGVWSTVCAVDADDPGLQVSGNQIMYTDTSVARNYGKGYIYSVSAKNGDIVTSYDTKGAAIYRLTPPSLKKITNTAAGTAEVSWTGVFGRTETNGNFDLQYAEYKDGKAGEFKSVITRPGYGHQTLSAQVTGLKKGSRYVFRIRCSKTNKDRGTYYSEYSPWLSVTITK